MISHDFARFARIDIVLHAYMEKDMMLISNSRLKDKDVF